AALAQHVDAGCVEAVDDLAHACWSEPLGQRRRSANVSEEGAHLDLRAAFRLDEPAHAEVAVTRVLDERSLPDQSEQWCERSAKWCGTQLTTRRARKLLPERAPRPRGRIGAGEIGAPALLVVGLGT